MDERDTRNGWQHGLLAIQATNVTGVRDEAGRWVAEALGADKPDAVLRTPHNPVTDACVTQGTRDIPLERGHRRSLHHRHDVTGGRTVTVSQTRPPFRGWHTDADPTDLLDLTRGRDVRSTIPRIATATVVHGERQRVEERLRLLEAVVAQATDMVIITEAAPLDEPGPRIVYVNETFIQTTGYTSAEVVGRSPRLLQGPGTDRAPLDALRAALTHHAPARVEVCNYRKDGTPFWSEMSVAPVADSHGAVTHYVSVQHDVTARRADEAALRALRRHNTAILAAAAEGIVGLDRAGCATFVNPAAAAILGYRGEEMVGRPLHALIHHTRADGSPYPPAACPIYAALTDGAARHVADEVFWRKDGSPVPVEYRSTPLDEEGAVVGAVLTFQDVTARRAAEEALRRQATHDALTGLSTGTVLRDRTEQALRLATRDGSPLALLLLDLDGFKRVNDTRGHDAGDHLLRVVADRLRATLRAPDTVARLGGDEFAVLLPGDTAEGATEAARSLLAALAAPVALEKQRVNVVASVGIALFPAHGVDAAGLLRHADAAMYTAKRAGGGYALAAGATENRDA